MSTINDSDLLAVERSGTLYQVRSDELSTLNTTDLLAVERSGTLYKIEAGDLNINSGSTATPVAVVTPVNGAGLNEGSTVTPVTSAITAVGGSGSVTFNTSTITGTGSQSLINYSNLITADSNTTIRNPTSGFDGSTSTRLDAGSHGSSVKYGYTINFDTAVGFMQSNNLEIYSDVRSYDGLYMEWRYMNTSGSWSGWSNLGNGQNTWITLSNNQNFRFKKLHFRGWYTGSGNPVCQMRGLRINGTDILQDNTDYTHLPLQFTDNSNFDQFSIGDQASEGTQYSAYLSTDSGGILNASDGFDGNTSTYTRPNGGGQPLYWNWSGGVSVSSTIRIYYDNGNAANSGATVMPITINPGRSDTQSTNASLSNSYVDFSFSGTLYGFTLEESPGVPSGDQWKNWPHLAAIQIDGNSLVNAGPFQITKIDGTASPPVMEVNGGSYSTGTTLSGSNSYTHTLTFEDQSNLNQIVGQARRVLSDGTDDDTRETSEWSSVTDTFKEVGWYLDPSTTGWNGTGSLFRGNSASNESGARSSSTGGAIWFTDGGIPGVTKFEIKIQNSGQRSGNHVMYTTAGQTTASIPTSSNNQWHVIYNNSSSPVTVTGFKQQLSGSYGTTNTWGVRINGNQILHDPGVQHTDTSGTLEVTLDQRTVTFPDSTNFEFFSAGNTVYGGNSTIQSIDTANSTMVVSGGDWIKWNTDQTWTSNLSNDGSSNSSNVANGFNGDLSDYTSNAVNTTTTATFATALTNVTKIRFYLSGSYNSSNRTNRLKVNSTDVSSQIALNRWIEISSPPSTLSSISWGTSNDASTNVRLHAVEVNGKVLVNNGTSGDPGVTLSKTIGVATFNNVIGRSSNNLYVSGVSGTWYTGTHVKGAQTTAVALDPSAVVFTSSNGGTTAYTGTAATLTARKWELSTGSSATGPWGNTTTYTDTAANATQNGSVPWSNPTLANNTFYRVKVTYEALNADDVSSSYNIFKTAAS